MRKSACVIPCFNEENNLIPICNEIAKLNIEYIDWYLINNGSTDINHKKFNSIIKDNMQSPHIYTYHIAKNKGIGYGIKTCLLEIIKNYEVVSWTHADGQTPIEDVVKAHEIYISDEDTDLVKGIRISRSDGVLATLFTTIYNIILLISGNYKSRSPNSQPTLIKSSFANSIISYAENDSNFDISPQ